MINRGSFIARRPASRGWPLLFVWLALAASPIFAQEPLDVKTLYTKSEHMIPMRDGVKLFTTVYSPRDASQKYPILLNRTPYSVSPYGPGQYKETIGPSVNIAKEGYIIVYQDVRGRYMSEGEFAMMTPFKPGKKGPKDTDESSDTYDTIEWLLKNVANNNGRAGMWGISYPGFYAAAGIMSAHPALKAASPQAPMADTFIGDDFHHNGALFLPHAFNFLSSFGRKRPGLTTERAPNFDYGTLDGYRFYLEMGPLSNANKKYFKDEIPIWNDYMKHGTYDEYWKAQNVPQHMKNITPAVLIVGGWFDSEDLYGPLAIYKAIERQSPSSRSTLVMGPWFHGGWARSEGDALGNIRFGSKTSLYYQEQVELPFFNYYLKNKGELHLPEAVVFNTGANRWRSFEQWPPANIEEKSLYLHAGGKLSFSAPANSRGDDFDEYVSDPKKPVPFTSETRITMGREFMVEDQRFVWTRPDVLSYETPALAEDVTIAGPIVASLFVSTSGTDSDFIVKLIDVYPPDAPDDEPNPANVHMGGFQMLVRGEVMRARFRNSYEKPVPMRPGKVTGVEFELRDAHHTFRKGHKIMVQIQSSWFPLVDRNPQKFVDIYTATEADFQKSTQRIYRAAPFGSHLKIKVEK
ncbi:MAG TPA: CocE/NonD family hydrolase [Blastocatellia bacterium]|nr:CocE/NonD family hydrolase [Blastocatellia bacterium]